jgi:hypothetical protein
MKRTKTNGRSSGRLSTLALIVWVSRAMAFHQPDRPGLPNFDKRAANGAQIASQDEGARAELKRLRAQVPDVQVDFHGILASPAWIHSATGFLSGPAGNGRGISARTAAGFPPGEKHREVKAFLDEHQALFGHNSGILENCPIEREFATPHSGANTVVWRQQLDGIPLFEALLTAHTTTNGELVSIASAFVPDPQRAARGIINRAALEAAPATSVQEAIVKAASNIGETLTIEEVVEQTPRSGVHGLVRRFRAARALKGEAEATMSWLPMNRAALRLCWELVLTSRTRDEMFLVLVDAETADVLVRHCLTQYSSDATYRVFTGDSPTPFSPGWPTPNAAQPPQVQRTLVTLPALDSTASPNGWINDGDNETRGNNVDAHTDLNGDDLPDLPRPQGSPVRVFDFPMDLTQSPGTYSSAAVVNLFYWCNLMHDRLYELGFTEATGNFQNDNFGRGGQGNDAVQADAQDGSGFNNSNFNTGGSDGSGARMQMYVFNGPATNRDGDLDAQIVLHEYTHGLSQRRVGQGTGISALQTAGMGEGWSDFYSLSVLSKFGDDPNATYAMAAYATFSLGGITTQNYYCGIRRYPYSTDLSKNPLTFKDIDPAQASAHSQVSYNPIFLFGVFPGTATEVHNMGEVWCMTLWEMRANLIGRYGFFDGNELALQLVTDGMNLSPANPTYLQARDAILQADQIDSGGANYVQLWTAFAKRGMGGGATSPASSTTSGVHEDFGIPPRHIYYVDAAAGPNGDGSPSAPFRTVTEAYQRALAFDVIRILAGHYPETFASINKTVRFESENGQAVIGKP